MGTHPASCSNYESGSDYTMEFGSFRFRFSAWDFAERVEHAAAQLGFIAPGGLSERELEDLVELAAAGTVERPASPLGAHVAEHGEALLGWDDDLVHWLRKLVFRSAWLDQQIKDGWLEPVFGEEGFSYVSAVNREPVGIQARTPDWSPVGYRSPSTG